MDSSIKDFDKWNELKKILHTRQEKVLFHEREIWWCSLGVNIGFEENGKNEMFERPVLILRKFNKYILWVLPLTRSGKNGDYYYRITQREEVDSVVILSQVRLISSKRLLRKMRMMKGVEFEDIKIRVKKFLP